MCETRTPRGTKHTDYAVGVENLETRAARPHTAPARAARRDDGARRDGDVERARDDAIDDRGRAARRDATREDAIGT